LVFYITLPTVMMHSQTQIKFNESQTPTSFGTGVPSSGGFLGTNKHNPNTLI